MKHRQKSLADLPFEVLRQAHWRGGEVQLCCRFKPEKTDEPEYKRLQRLWLGKEVFFNFALENLLMGLSPKELGAVCTKLSGLKFGSSLLMDSYEHSLKKIIGIPDFVISDKNSCLLVESKLTAKYGLEQFVKYQLYAFLGSITPGLPKAYAHLIVARGSDLASLRSNIKGDWCDIDANGRLEILEESHSKVEAKKSKGAAYLASILSEELVSEPVRFKSKASTSIPTRVLTWEAFFDSLDSTMKRKDLLPATFRLRAISEGTAEIEEL